MLYCKIYLAVQRHRNQIQAFQVHQVAQNGETGENDATLRKFALGTFYVSTSRAFSLLLTTEFSLAYVVLSEPGNFCYKGVHPVLSIHRSGCGSIHL